MPPKTQNNSNNNKNTETKLFSKEKRSNSMRKCLTVSIILFQMEQISNSHFLFLPSGQFKFSAEQFG